jgi:hypothetical protein
MSPDAESLPEQRPPGVRWRTWLRLSEEFRELRHVEAEYMLRLIYGGNGPALWEQIGLNRGEVMPHLRPATDMAGYRRRKRAGVYEPDDWLVSVLRQYGGASSRATADDPPTGETGGRVARLCP